jgi:uracil-DNA glycosylase
VFGDGPSRAEFLLVGEQPGDREEHFKWEPRGKKRIHQKPNSSEIAACRPWLDAEIAAVRPRVLVCLGATAAQAVFGPSFRVTKSRGEIRASDLAPLAAATVHPSSILRAPDPRSRRLETERFVRDLAKIARAVDRSQGAKPGKATSG